MRSDGSNLCRHIPKFPERGKTRLIADAELKRLYAYLSKAEAEGFEHPLILLAIRLRFEFAARMSEILKLEWPLGRSRQPPHRMARRQDRRHVEADERRGSSPARGGAPFGKSPYVCPSIFDPNRPMLKHTYYRAGGASSGVQGCRTSARTGSGIARRPMSQTPVSP